jgi:hypothetical protein
MFLANRSELLQRARKTSYVLRTRTEKEKRDSSAAQADTPENGVQEKVGLLRSE